MKIVHYTDGYGGKLNYKTYCGKEIHSHSETEDASIDPSEVTCNDCKGNEKLIEDLADSQTPNSGIRRRIYLESDVLHADELRSSQREVAQLCEEKHEKYVRRVFQEVIDFAWHELDKTWQAVKNADEIYSDSSLMPLVGGSYMGAPVIFNAMCERAIEENVTGKEVYILKPLKDINWYMIKIDVMLKAFKNNKLFMYDNDGEIQQVDAKKVAKENKKR
jgi:hypothetical protein